MEKARAKLSFSTGLEICYRSAGRILELAQALSFERINRHITSTVIVPDISSISIAREDASAIAAVSRVGERTD